MLDLVTKFYETVSVNKKKTINLRVLNEEVQTEVLEASAAASLRLLA